MKRVNTAAVKQYDGLKYSDDQHNAFWLAHLMRLGILPTGKIYPKELRQSETCFVVDYHWFVPPARN